MMQSMARNDIRHTPNFHDPNSSRTGLSLRTQSDAAGVSILFHLSLFNHSARIKQMRKKLTTTLAIIALAVIFYGGYRLLPGILADELYPLDYVNEFKECSDMFGVDRALAVSVAKGESGFNARAVSRAGAQGIMQLMPLTYRGVNSRVFDGKFSDPYDPKSNICVGVAHLAGLLGTYNGDVTATLIAYNGGDGAARRYLSARSTSVLVLETRMYPTKILANYEVYKNYPELQPLTVGATGVDTSGGSVKPAAPTPAATKTPEPVKIDIPTPQEKTNDFWKGFFKGAFARFIS